MTTITVQTAAVEALVAALPTPTQLTARIAGAEAGIDASTAVVGSFVGAVSAEVAVVLVDQAGLAAAGGEGPQIDVADVLRPALEAATSVLGAGVLGETRAQDASALFVADGALVFELLDRAGKTAGAFAIRVHDTGTAAADVPTTKSLGRISDVEMSMTVEIGRTRRTVQSLLGLEPGDVVELDRSAGAPADILVNGKIIGQGEVIVVDQDYAVRVTRIFDTADASN